MTSFKDASSIN